MFSWRVSALPAVVRRTWAFLTGPQGTQLPRRWHRHISVVLCSYEFVVAECVRRALAATPCWRGHGVDSLHAARMGPNQSAGTAGAMALIAPLGVPPCAIAGRRRNPVRPSPHLLCAILALSTACDGDPSEAAASEATAALHGCESGVDLAGASYAIEKSKFAFGSMPTKSESGGLTRWTGSQGVVAIFPSGSAMGLPNAGAPESAVGDWSSTEETPAEHVRAYFVSMGMASCQSMNTQTLGGSAGTTISVNREVSGIPVIGSTAYAQFNAHDLTTSEGFFWPTIPASVVTSARALQTQLSRASGLAAYKAKLPEPAQGEGQVVIHHSGGTAPGAFEAVASYDVISGRSTLSFDANGQPVTPPQ